ncbi:hypothetical protein SAMN05446037_10813 [Anaerovirgula multivorans]|uniref:Uncharacterized protein n=1 Tax=Anaerovirgula multivorans TaxID=312168 RepID=A0A239LHP3_9FIRM|nr:hypothetical protein [Anaerovirgula multivorans]SNT29810.1 hypothetical protein SAMN05446037_10813 [Anaerovirgula multivorans]
MNKLLNELLEKNKKMQAIIFFGIIIVVVAYSLHIDRFTRMTSFIAVMSAWGGRLAYILYLYLKSSDARIK